ncbi:MAG: hypothetical protein M0C28_03870 [Candidatus Moduliflexus flocculans]|nr:hypothetical protein [Candidatus Moduliflexus flocculans]
MAVVYRQVDFMRHEDPRLRPGTAGLHSPAGRDAGLLSGPEGGAPPEPARPRRDRDEPGPDLPIRQLLGRGVGRQGPREPASSSGPQSPISIIRRRWGSTWPRAGPFRREFATDEGGAFLVNEEVARLMGLTAAGRGRQALQLPGHPGAHRRCDEELSLHARPEPARAHGRHRHAQRPSASPSCAWAAGTSPAALWPGRGRLAGASIRVIPSNTGSSTTIMTQSYRAVRANGGDPQVVRRAGRGRRLPGPFRAWPRSWPSSGSKEVGVRKVLGASSGQVVVLLSRNSPSWVLLANLVAWPAAYFALAVVAAEVPFPDRLFAPALSSWPGPRRSVIALLTVSGQA